MHVCALLTTFTGHASAQPALPVMQPVATLATPAASTVSHEVVDLTSDNGVYLITFSALYLVEHAHIRV